MNAVVMHERGGPEVLRYESVPTPAPARGEVLLRVHAATVNHTDIFHRTGQFFIQKALPHVLGMDVAGEIADVGEGVTGWRVGDRCAATFEALGRERDGAYAEYTTIPAGELHRIPDELDYVAAASIGLAFTTAWLALFHRATFVLELVGRPTLQPSVGMLAPDGRIVCAGTLGGDVAEINVMDLIMKRGHITGSFAKIPASEYDDILRLFATGTFRPVIACVMPLRDAKLAHERVEAKQAFGKVVLVP